MIYFKIPTSYFNIYNSITCIFYFSHKCTECLADSVEPLRVEFKQRMASLLKAYPPSSQPPPASTASKPSPASTPEIDLIALNLSCPYCLMEYKQTGRLGPHIVKKHMIDTDNIVLKCKIMF